MFRKEEKHLDLELLVFFLSISFLNFIFYLLKNPLVVSIIKYKKWVSYSLFSAYLTDLLIFLSVILPYFGVIIFLIIIKLMKKVKKIPDNIMVILFFPILSFFTKGMSLLEIYIDYTFEEIIKENFAFFSFLFIGPLIVIAHKVIMRIKKKIV